MTQNDSLEPRASGGNGYTRTTQNRVPQGLRVRLPPRPPLSLLKRRKLAYLVGAALGDGNLSNPNGRAIRLRITCFAGYTKIAKEILDTIRFLFPKNAVSIVGRNPNCFDISLYSNRLADWIPWQVNKGSKMAQHAHVPLWIMEDARLSQECLRGLIQTDGCIYTDRGYLMINFVNNTEELVEDAQDILIDLGYHPTFSKVPNGRNPKYSVRIARSNEAKDLVQKLQLYKA